MQTLKISKSAALLILSSLLVGMQLIGGTLGQLGAATGYVLVFALAFAANVRFLSVILLLCLPSYGIRQFGDGMYALYFPELVSFVPILGVDWTAGLCLMLGAFARVVIEFMARSSTLRFGVGNIWIAGLCISIMITVYGGILGYLEGYNRATTGVRAILALGGYFWGLILVSRANRSVTELASQMNTIVVVGLVLLSAGFLRGHINFLLFGLLGGLIVYWFIHHRWFPAALGTLALGFALTGSLTVLGILVTAILLSSVMFLPWFRMRGLALWSNLAGLLTIASALVIVGVTQFSETGYDVRVADRTDDLLTYAGAKLFADRAPLWSGAVDLIRSGPYLIVPSGRSLVPAQEFLYRGLDDWRSGAHNAVLELFVNVGVVAGLWGFALMLFVVRNLSAVARYCKNGILKACVAGVLGVVVIGSLAGNFPVQDVGFLVWAMAGWAVAVHGLENRFVSKHQSGLRNLVDKGSAVYGS